MNAMADLQLIFRFAPVFLVVLGYSQVASQQPPAFDGVIRPTSDGRLEAYMVPPYPSNHASNIEIIPNEGGMGVDMLATWFSGGGEGQSGAAIVMSRLRAGSMIWTNATIMSQREGYSNQNPVIFYYNTTKSQKLLLFHSQQPAGVDESHAEIWALESGPSGQNWTEPRPVLTKPGSYDRNRMLLTLNDTALLPIYYSVKYLTIHKSSVMEWNGENVTNSRSWTEHPMTDTPLLIQPTIVRLKPGEPVLIAFFRDDLSLFVYRAVSDDDGRTWSRPTTTTLPNNNSGIQACALLSGNIALVYNPTHSERNPLVISLSEDYGLTWSYTRIIMASTEEGSEFSYPSIIQNTRDGTIHITHTYDRKTIKYTRIPNEEWIKQG